MTAYDIRRPGVPAGFIRGAGGRLLIPSRGGRFGYPFDPFPAFGGSRPVHAFSANTAQGSGGNFTTAPNHGTAGGTWDIGASNNAPRLTTNELGLRPSLDFDRPNNEAIHTSSTQVMTNPFTFVIVMDIDGTNTAVFIGSSENGTTNDAQFYQSGANMRWTAGTLRSDPGIDTDRNVYWGVSGNSSSVSQLVKSDDGVSELLGTGSVGTGVWEGISLGSNGVPEVVNTMDGDIAYFAAWNGEFGYGANADFAALMDNLASYYDTDGL